MTIRPLNANSLFLDERRRHQASVVKIFEQILSERECFELTLPERRNAVKEALDILKNASEDCRGGVVRTLAEILSMCVEEQEEIEKFREILSGFISDKLDGDSERVFGDDEALCDAGTLFGSLIGIELPLTFWNGGWLGIRLAFKKCALLLDRDSNPSMKPVSNVFFRAAREFLLSSPSFFSNFASSEPSKAGTWEDALLSWAQSVDGTGAIMALLLEGEKQKKFLEDLSVHIERAHGRTKQGVSAPSERIENSTKEAILCILRSAKDIPDHVRLGFLSFIAGKGAFATLLSEGVLRVSDIPALDGYFVKNDENEHDSEVVPGLHRLNSEYSNSCKSSDGEPFFKLFLRRTSEIDADLASKILESSLGKMLDNYVTLLDHMDLDRAVMDKNKKRDMFRDEENVLSALVAKIAERNEGGNDETPVL